MEKLGDICKFQSGGTPSKSNPLYFGGTIPWITTVALNGSMIGAENAVEWITKKAIMESAAKIVPANSIMVGTRVGVGKVAINSVPMSTSQDIISLIEIDESKWDKSFICEFISSQNAFLLSQARGATIKGIKIETLSELVLPDIQINDQKIIAEKFKKIGSLRLTMLQAMNKLEVLKKLLMQEYFG